MVFKVVFQIPFDEGKWDEEWAREMRVEMPGNPNGPHIKIYANEKDAETGENVTFIRCKHTNLEDLKKYVNKIMERLPEVL